VHIKDLKCYMCRSPRFLRLAHVKWTLISEELLTIPREIQREAGGESQKTDVRIATNIINSMDPKSSTSDNKM
jgi:hypothetical protein